MSVACDLAIRGGTVVTASDSFRADIGVRDGRIVAISERIEDASEEIDATGLLVLPGAIDAHVHLAQPTSDGTVMADDFETGTRSAAAGGNTTVLPFAMQVKGKSLRDCVTAYHGQAEGKCYTDVSFHLVVSDPTPQVLGQELPALVRDGYTSFKVFMTYDDLMLTDAEPILFSEGVSKGRISVERFVALTSTNPARFYGLHPQKGSIAIGADADIKLWVPTRRDTIRQERLCHGSDYTPYEGMEILGWPDRTILRGRRVARDGRVAGTPSGRYRSRSFSEAVTG